MRLAKNTAKIRPRFLTCASWIGLFLLTSCTSPAMLSRMIIDEPTRMVRLEVLYRGGVLEHSHPVTLSPDTFKKMLQSISVPPNPSFLLSSGTDHNVHPAFHDEQIQFFSQAFATAFAKATSLEDVMFYWSEDRNPGLQNVTSGRGYMHDQEFHLIVSNYQQTTSGRRQAHQVKEEPEHMLGGHHVRLEPGAFGQARPEHPWNEFMESSPQHLVLRIPVSAQETDRATSTRTKQQTSSAPQSPTILEKLETLHSLREKDLISEEEYQNKRRKILENF